MLIYSELDDPFVTGFTNKELSSAGGRGLSLLNFSFSPPTQFSVGIFSKEHKKNNLSYFRNTKQLTIVANSLQQTFQYLIGILSDTNHLKLVSLASVTNMSHWHILAHKYVTKCHIFMKPHCS